LDTFSFVGLFNVCDKALVSLEVLLELREFYKRGVPLSSAIEGKFDAWMKQLNEVFCFNIEVVYWYSGRHNTQGGLGGVEPPYNFERLNILYQITQITVMYL
jgi:hypothetical protein